MKMRLFDQHKVYLKEVNMNRENIKQIVKRVTEHHRSSYIIVRTQSRREIAVLFNNGRLENISTTTEKGMGVQAFTAKGACGLASANEIGDEMGRKLAEKASDLAVENERIGCELNDLIYKLSPNVSDLPSNASYNFDSLTPEELKGKIASIHQILLGVKPNDGYISWQTSYRQVEDHWCIGRSDGTLVSFNIPRTVLFHQGTIKKGNSGQSFSVYRSGVDIGILIAEHNDNQLLKEAKEKCILIEKVSQAPLIPAGSYSIIIDHGLAKGLAHEAFGHAVESDLVEESVLSENGKLKIGLEISGKEVDIIDGSLNGDWAYQPYSANGEKRQTVAIVKNGILKQGLGDVFSAAKSGMEATGAGRAEYYGSVPLPRMTNIRLISRNHISLPPSDGLEEEIINIRKVLDAQNLLAEDHHFLLLGYRGGQVNAKTGDFVFQCDGAVNLSDPTLPVYRPGIFSGKILSVLKSVTLSLGEERYDAIGTCGKAGQKVPSSGGGSGYIVLTKNDQVRLGGSESGK